MARIKINDLPKDHQVSKQEMKQVFGGLHAPDGMPIMDSRLSYLISLSQTLKKISGTQDSIVQNIK